MRARWTELVVIALCVGYVQSRGLRSFRQEPSSGSNQLADAITEDQSLLPPGLVAVLIGSKADEWTKEGQKVLRGELEDTIALADIRGSCLNATSTVIKSFHGFKAHILSQLRKICRSNEMGTPSRSAVCDQYTSGMATYLTGNQNKNLQIDLGDFCGDVYDKGVLQAAENQQAADDQAKAKARKEAARQMRLKKRKQQDDALAVLADAEDGLKKAEIKHRKKQKQEETLRTKEMADSEEDDVDDLPATQEELDARLDEQASEATDGVLLKKEVLRQAEIGAQSLSARLMRQERIHRRRENSDDEDDAVGNSETDEADVSNGDLVAEVASEAPRPSEHSSTMSEETVDPTASMPPDEIAMDAADAAMHVTTDDLDMDIAPPSVAASSAVAASEDPGDASQTDDQ